MEAWESLGMVNRIASYQWEREGRARMGVSYGNKEGRGGRRGEYWEGQQKLRFICWFVWETDTVGAS